MGWCSGRTNHERGMLHNEQFLVWEWCRSWRCKDLHVNLERQIRNKHLHWLKYQFGGWIQGQTRIEQMRNVTCPPPVNNVPILVSTNFCNGHVPSTTLWGIKKHTKICFTITFIKLGQFWINLADCLLNKFSTKQCKQLSPDPSTSFTLSGETWKSLMQV